MSRSTRRRRQRGAALLAAIAGAGLLSALAVEIIGTAQEEIRLVEAFREEFRVRWALRAPVAVLIAALKEEAKTYTGLTGKWANLGKALSVDGVQVRFEVHDESSKMNLNALASANATIRGVTEAALKRMFRELALDASVVDALRRLAEEEAGTAPQEQGKAEPKPILRSLSEVRLIRRFTPAVLRTLGFREPAGVIETDWSERLTIYSDGRINVNTAGPFLLRQLSEELTDLFIQDLIDRRKERPVENLAELKLMPGMTEPLYNKLAPSLTVQSRFFSVTAEASSGRVRKRLTAVLEKGKDGVALLYWRIR